MSAMLKARGPISRTSLGRAVYENILDAILSGTLASGAELSEVALAGELAVSRTPVHEALRRLAADGLVTQLANRRARVATFTRDDIREIYDMRMVLEAAAAERAAKQIDANELAALREEADALVEAPASRMWPGRAIDFDLRFHDTLASAAGNERLRAEVVKYRHLVRAFCRISGSADNLRKALDEHRRVLTALEARDAAAARSAMTAHIRARLEGVLRELDATAAAS